MKHLFGLVDELGAAVAHARSDIEAEIIRLGGAIPAMSVEVAGVIHVSGLCVPAK